MSDQVDKIKTDSQKYIVKTTKYVAIHRVFLILVIASCAIIFALLRTRNYLNPPRDQNVYIEKTSEINPKKIDQEILTKLKDTEADQNSEVDSNLAPGRDNPFVE